jgi:hypothetical protein
MCEELIQHRATSNTGDVQYQYVYYNGETAQSCVPAEIFSQAALLKLNSVLACYVCFVGV